MQALSESGTLPNTPQDRVTNCDTPSPKKRRLLPLNNWMSNFKDIPLSQLLLPGSHDSAAFTSYNFLMGVRKHMRCQKLRVIEQL